MGIGEFIINYWDWYLYAASITWGAATIKEPPTPSIMYVFTFILTILAWPVLLLLMLTDK